VAYVKLKKNESLNSLIRRFKRKVQQEAIIKEIKKHSAYIKPGERKRLQKEQSLKRIRKRKRRETTTI
jgi:small subunit ribosomal protein S21